MINYIIYEDEKKYREKYISVILKMHGDSEDSYQIIEIDKYEKKTKEKLSNIVGKKVYILDIEVPGKSGLDLARQIRNEGDWESPMIIVTTHEQLRNDSFSGRLLMLDFVSKYYNCEDHLKESLMTAYDIITKQKSLNFVIEGELYQIPYNNIMYIKTKSEEANCIIVTDKKELETKEGLGKIEKKLDGRFYRSHRSCIVNTHNIRKVDFNNSIIRFENVETKLLSRDKKKELKEKLCNKQIKSDKKVKKG